MQKQLAEYIFAKGIESQTDAKIVAPGSLLVLENGRFRKAGAIEKRYGQQPLVRNIFGTTSRILSALAIARLGDELLLADTAGELYSYSPSLQTWIDKGAVSPVAVRSKPLVRNTYQQSNPDSATRNGVTVHAWTDTRGGIYADVIDEASGTKMLADENLSATGIRPRVVAVDTAILVVYQEAGEVKCRAVRVAKPTEFAAAELLATDASIDAVTQHLDACPSSIPEAAFFAYNTGAASIKVGYIRRDGSAGDPGNGGYPNLATIAEPAKLALAIAVDPDTRDVFVFYSNGAAVRTAALHDDFTERNAPSLVETIDFVMNVAPALVDGAWTLFYEVFATKAYNRLVKKATVSMAGVASGVAVLQRGAGLASKAFVRDGHAHAAIVHDSRSDDIPDPVVPFSPLEIAGLVHWHDASDPTTIFTDAGGTIPVTADGQAIARVADKSGNNYYLVKGANAPLYKTAIQNGLSVFRFAGTSHLARPAVTPITPQPYTIYVVWRATGGSLPAVVLYDVATAGGTQFDVDGTDLQVVATSTGGFAGSAVTVSGIAPFLCSSIIYNGVASHLYKNGVADAAGDAGASSLTGLVLASDKDFAFPLTGDIAEILLYSGAHNGAQRASVEGYLMDKWGL